MSPPLAPPPLEVKGRPPGVFLFDNCQSIIIIMFVIFILKTSFGNVDR